MCSRRTRSRVALGTWFGVFFLFFLTDAGLVKSGSVRVNGPAGGAAEGRTSSVGRPRSPPAPGALGAAVRLGPPGPGQTEGPAAPRSRSSPAGGRGAMAHRSTRPAAHLRRLVVFLFLLLKKQQHLGTEGTLSVPGWAQPPHGQGRAGGGITNPLVSPRTELLREVPPVRGRGWTGSTAAATASGTEQGDTGPSDTGQRTWRQAQPGLQSRNSPGSGHVPLRWIWGDV